MSEHLLNKILEKLDTEYYSPEDLADIREGLEQIRRGEFVTHEELKRRI